MFSTYREREREWSLALYLHTEAFTDSLGRQGDWWACFFFFFLVAGMESLGRNIVVFFFFKYTHRG